MAFSADSEYKTGGSGSKTVMGHWPIESSNLSLSATAFWRGLRAVACIRNLVLGTGFRVFRTRAAGLLGELVPLTDVESRRCVAIR